MNETPIYLKSKSKNTIAPIGAKTVYIRTHRGEKTRIVVILCKGAEGTKLPPLLVFKGRKMEKKNHCLINMKIISKKYSLFAKTIFG